MLLFREEEVNDLGVNVALSMLKFYKSKFLFAVCYHFISDCLLKICVTTYYQYLVIDQGRLLSIWPAHLLMLYVNRRDITLTAFKLPLCANVQRVLYAGVQKIWCCEGYNLDSMASVPL